MPCSTEDNGNVAVPLSLFIAFACLSALGIIYSTILIAFNVAYRKNKMIKMTSPNINIIILLGTIIGYSCIVIAGFDTSAALQACSFLASIAFTLVYGSLFTKVCRVFMIFSSLSFNGKTSRDEHLLLAVFMLILIDLVILLPWQLIDPITCEYWQSFAEPEPAVNVTVSAAAANGSCTLVQTCSSQLQVVWISVIYVYKAVILAAGLYFTWNTRQVTLPALKDAALLATIVLTIAVASLTALPALLTSSDSAQSVSSTAVITRYAVCSTALWLGLIITVSLLFVPKILLVRRHQKQKQQAAAATLEDTQLQFSESMRTKESVGSCWPCLNSGSQSNETEQYAVEVLATEIHTLKRTIKEKDATIRELTDRLYVGAEQFHRYLTSTTRTATDRAVVPNRAMSTNAISPVAPASAAPPDEGQRTRRPRGTFSYGDSSNESSSDDDDDDEQYPPQRPQKDPRRRPQQLNVSNFLTNGYKPGRPAGGSSTALYDQHSVVGQHEDSAFETPSAQSSSDAATNCTINSSSSRSRSSAAAVAVIHCQPIAATAADFRRNNHVTVASITTAQAMTSHDFTDTSMDTVYQPFAVYQI